MTHTIQERTMAFAGVFQATELVHQIASTGNLNQDAFEASINSLFETDPESTDMVYRGIKGLELGMQSLIKQLGSKGASRDMYITRYVIGLMHLERKLNKQPDMMQKIGQGIENAKLQIEHYSLTHANVIANLAGTYQDTISTLTPKIMVSGDHGYLNNPENASKVRALLLAGIRSVILWRQCGGNRFQLLFKRNELLKAAQHLVETIQSQ
jgi:high frequency lysogenization protein